MTKRITIVEHLPALMRDIQDRTYLLARAKGTGPEDAADIQVSDEDCESVMRSVTEAVGVLRSAFSDYVANDFADCDNRPLDSCKPVVIALDMPFNFNAAVKGALADAVHQMIVNTAISNWLSDAGREDAEGYSTAAAAALSRATGLLAQRSRPVRTSVDD